jgi:hypothetical protein
MQSRLLTFLSDFERTLLTDDPTPDNGTWQNHRTVNYGSGLARIQLNVLTVDKTIKPRGGVLLQGYALADGTPCLKASLSWAGAESPSVFAIFPKPGKDWKGEARRLAAEWMAGPPSADQAMENPEPVMAEAAAG